MDFDLAYLHIKKVFENHLFGSNCLPSVEVKKLEELKRKINKLEISFSLTKIENNYVAEFIDMKEIILKLRHL